jgi:muconolactone D-isomerase
MSVEYKQRVSREEVARAGELTKLGHLVRMWRVPCRFENWGIWRAKNATELHEIITSLPAYPWMINIDVHPLAKHAVDPTPYEVA